jgi:hypothetical protein
MYSANVLRCKGVVMFSSVLVWYGHVWSGKGKVAYSVVP